MFCDNETGVLKAIAKVGMNTVMSGDRGSVGMSGRGSGIGVSRTSFGDDCQRTNGVSVTRRAFCIFCNNCRQTKGVFVTRLHGACTI